MNFIKKFDEVKYHNYDKWYSFFLTIIITLYYLVQYKRPDIWSHYSRFKIILVLIGPILIILTSISFILRKSFLLKILFGFFILSTGLTGLILFYQAYDLILAPTGYGDEVSKGFSSIIILIFHIYSLDVIKKSTKT